MRARGRRVLTPESDEMQKADNAVIKNIRDGDGDKDNAWLLDPTAADQSEALELVASNIVCSPFFKDFERCLAFHNVCFLFSKEYQNHYEFKNQTPPPTKEAINQHYVEQVQAFIKRVLFNNNQNDFNCHYPRILKFYTQRILYPFKQAIQLNNTLSINNEFLCNITFDGKAIKLDVLMYSFNIVNMDVLGSRGYPLCTHLPISLCYSAELTDKGFKFSSVDIPSGPAQQDFLCDKIKSSEKEKSSAAIDKTLAENLEENIDYFACITERLPDSPHRKLIIETINQTKNLYLNKKITAKDYVTIVNTLLEMAVFIIKPTPDIIQRGPLLELLYKEKFPDLHKNLIVLGKVIYKGVKELIAKEDSRGFDNDLRSLKKMLSRENFFPRTWRNLSNFAKDHPILMGILAITLITAATIGLTIATMGVGTIAALVATALTYMGLAGTITGFVASSAMAAAAIGAGMVATAAYVSFGLAFLISESTRLVKREFSLLLKKSHAPSKFKEKQPASNNIHGTKKTVDRALGIDQAVPQASGDATPVPPTPSAPVSNSDSENGLLPLTPRSRRNSSDMQASDSGSDSTSSLIASTSGATSDQDVTPNAIFLKQ